MDYALDISLTENEDDAHPKNQCDVQSDRPGPTLPGLREIGCLPDKVGGNSLDDISQVISSSDENSSLLTVVRANLVDDDGAVDVLVKWEMD